MFILVVIFVKYSAIMALSGKVKRYQYFIYLIVVPHHPFMHITFTVLDDGLYTISITTANLYTVVTRFVCVCAGTMLLIRYDSD